MTHEDKPLLDKLLDQNPTLPFWFNTSLGILLTLIGSITIFQLLTTPTVRDPESEHSAICSPVSRLRSAPDHIDVSMDQAETRSRDHCTRIREDLTSKAIFVAVPTTIIGSVTATAFVFRRKLGPRPAEENAPEE